jgi:energy-coupling factor transporter ATP-binding protein EcfA2
MSKDKQTRYIAKLIIKNFLGIEEAEMSVGDGLKIMGRTGSGKTTIVHALQAVFDKNTRTKMVQMGKDQGDVMLIMSDGTTATRKISDDGTERAVVTGPNGKPVSSPATVLQKMAPALLFNPIRFVQMDETQKAKVLADVFPVELTQAELQAICGEDVDLREVDESGNGLARANQAYKAAYKARHSANGELKQAESSRDTERKKIPENFDAASVRGLSSEDIANQLGKIEHHNRLVTDGTKQMTQLEGEKTNLNTEIENLRNQLAAKEAQLAAVETRLQKGREWLEKNQTIDPAPTQATLHSLDQQRMYLHCFDQADAYDKQCKEIAARALRLDAIVTTLNALPGELVRRSNIPIPGLTVENGVVHVNGLPINNLSDGEQYRIAVRVAAAGTKDLRFVCIDGAEAMSEVARDQLIDDLKAEGIQVFVTVASECDFNICDLEGNPADARVKLAPKIDATAPVGAAPVNMSLQAPLSARAVNAPTRVTTKPPVVESAKAPTPVAMPTTSLFDPAPAEEELFGEPSI